MAKNVKITIAFSIIGYFLKTVLEGFFTVRSNVTITQFYYQNPFLVGLVVVFLTAAVLYVSYLLCVNKGPQRFLVVSRLLSVVNGIVGFAIALMALFALKTFTDFDTIVGSYFGVEVVRIWWPADYLTTTLYEVVKEKFGPDVAGLIDYKGCIRVANNNLPNAVALALAQAAEVGAHFSPTIHSLFTAFGKPWVYSWGQVAKLVFVSSTSVVCWGMWCFFVQKALIFTAATAWSGVGYIFMKPKADTNYTPEGVANALAALENRTESLDFLVQQHGQHLRDLAGIASVAAKVEKEFRIHFSVYDDQLSKHVVWLELLRKMVHQLQVAQGIFPTVVVVSADEEAGSTTTTAAEVISGFVG